jgi:hypothetical protein
MENVYIIRVSIYVKYSCQPPIVLITDYSIDDPQPFIDGLRINSPHYLCKIRLDPTSARK